MKRPVSTPSKPQLALQSYLDGLLQEATDLLDATPATAAAPAAVPLDPPAALDGAAVDAFAAAVREEQARDALRPTPVAVDPARAYAEPPRTPRPPVPTLTVVPSVPPPLARVAPDAMPSDASAVPEPVAPLVEVHLPTASGAAGVPADPADNRPGWAAEPFECLLFDVAGLTLAVPLVCLGSIYPLVGQDLTPLFGQPDWFLGILPCQAGNLKVLDTARWVMPDRYRDDLRQGLQYVISVQGYEWGLAVHQVSRSLRLDPSEIKWRSQRGQRPWLAGTVIEHMCALLDVAQLAELIASGATRQQSRAPT